MCWILNCLIFKIILWVLGTTFNLILKKETESCKIFKFIHFTANKWLGQWFKPRNMSFEASFFNHCTTLPLSPVPPARIVPYSSSQTQSHEFSRDPFPCCLELELSNSPSPLNSKTVPHISVLHHHSCISFLLLP